MSDTGPRHDPRRLNGVFVAHDDATIWVRRDANWHGPTAEVPLESETLLQLFTYAVQHDLLRRPN